VVLIGVLVVRDTQLGSWSCVYEVGNIGCLPVQ